MMIRIAYVVSVMFLAGACGGDGPSDATSTQMLVGTWSRHTVRFGNAEDETYVFAADGTFKHDRKDTSSEEHEAGTYRVVNGALVTEQFIRVTATVYVGETAFARIAYLPLGAHDGIVGIWEASYLEEYVDDPTAPLIRWTRRLSITADGKWSESETWTDGTMSGLSGTWSAEPDGSYSLCYVQPMCHFGICNDNTYCFTYLSIDGATLASEFDVYGRVRE